MIFNYITTTITYMQQFKKNNLIALAKRVKSLRIERCDSLNKFCFDSLNITSATWSRIENALVDPKFSTLVEVCNMLKINLSELFENLEISYEDET